MDLDLRAVADVLDDGVDGDDDCDGDGGRVGLGKVIGSPPSATAV